MIDPAPSRRPGRTQRMLEKAVELSRSESTVIVASNWHHAEALRARISRLCGGPIPRNLRFTHGGPDFEAAVSGVTHVLWDHTAHELVKSRLENERQHLSRRIELLDAEISAHYRIEVEQ